MRVVHSLRRNFAVNKLSLHRRFTGREAQVGTLQEAVVVVTGASRGLGAAIAEELGRGGAHVVVYSSPSSEPPAELVSTTPQGASRAPAVQGSAPEPAHAPSVGVKAI